MIRDLDLKRDNIAFFKKFEKDSRFIKVNPEVAHKTYSDLISKGIGKVFILCDNETGAMAGGMGMLKAPDLHDGVMTAVETFFFVAPEYRNGWGAFSLLRAFDKWAKETGCKRKALIHLVDSSPERLKRLYEIMGYTLVESHYICEV